MSPKHPAHLRYLTFEEPRFCHRDVCFALAGAYATTAERLDGGEGLN